MRKVSALFAAVMAAGLLSVGVAQAEPSDRCGGAPAATDGSSFVAVCVAGVGKAEANAQGYVIADGDSGNTDPTDGYIGVDDRSGVVCSDEGDYDYATSTTCNPAP